MRKYVFVYFNRKALCTNAEEAISFINSLEFRGNGHRLVCNENCCNRLHALYEGEPVYHPSGNVSFIKHNGKFVEGFSDLATTGCSTTRILIYPALADTIEEHDRIYSEKIEEEKVQRLAENEQRIQNRLAELHKEKKGWYSVGLNFDRAKFGRSGIYYNESDFSACIIASSGADAFNKTIKHLIESVDVLPDSQYPEMISSRYYFEFLGVKTDDGYSVDLWEKWKEEGVLDENNR